MTDLRFSLQRDDDAWLHDHAAQAPGMRAERAQASWEQRQTALDVGDRAVRDALGEVFESDRPVIDWWADAPLADEARVRLDGYDDDGAVDVR